MPAPERIPPGSVTAADLLARGELTVRGRIREASNAALYCTVRHEEREAACVYKPIAGERPLWDFPDGTLAGREVAAYEVGRALGWDQVPPTVLRDGPYGRGMCQLWVEPAADSDLLALVDTEEPEPGWKAVARADVGGGRTALLVHADDERLRRLAVLDVVINNADRKGGHLLPTGGGALYGIDHGVTFHVEHKLRTLLWGWAGEPLTAEAVTALAALRDRLAGGGDLRPRLTALITHSEIEATRARVDTLLESGVHPRPDGRWPTIPWPPM
ncbi:MULTISPECIES: SCO1664 family protein [unclassified Streptomyces]|uniref:SCO1664 family protein n=1 Tax=unclassified Streptomyces TaxID=2593676 RepID=UPI0019089245|nr:SCO1664 family protein [Streptomyces sp. HSG2]